jgi:hypothetical protein
MRVCIEHKTDIGHITKGTVHLQEKKILWIQYWN